jgi:preprotein translocase subunit SecG
MSLLIGFLLFVHIIISFLMVGAVLMQLPRSEGLGAAFGGGMTENVFGAQTTNVLSKATVWLGMGFFAVTLLLAMAYSSNQPTGEAIERKLLESTTTAVESTAEPSAETVPATDAQDTETAMTPPEAEIPSAAEAAPAIPDVPSTEATDVRAPEMNINAATPVPPALLDESEAAITLDGPLQTAPPAEEEAAGQQ